MIQAHLVLPKVIFKIWVPRSRWQHSSNLQVCYRHHMGNRETETQRATETAKWCSKTYVWLSLYTTSMFPKARHKSMSSGWNNSLSAHVHMWLSEAPAVSCGTICTNVHLYLVYIFFTPLRAIAGLLEELWTCKATTLRAPRACAEVRGLWGSAGKHPCSQRVHGSSAPKDPPLGMQFSKVCEKHLQFNLNANSSRKKEILYGQVSKTGVSLTY